MSAADDLEDMLHHKEDIHNAVQDGDNLTILPSELNSGKRLKSDKSATMYDLIRMINKLVEIRMGDSVKFMPNEAQKITLDAMKNFDTPIITYKTISREPDLEIKARIRETFKDNVGRVGEVAGQNYKCYVQFDIFATKYDQAEQIMNDFEELISNHTGYLKRNGVRQIIFHKQITDDFYANVRETLSIRNLVYYVEIEKNTVIIKERIKEIEALADQELQEEDNNSDSDTNSDISQDQGGNL